MSTGTITAPVATSAAPHAGRPAREAQQIRSGERGEGLHLASSACTVLALICIWMLLQLFVLGRVSENRTQHLLYSKYRTELATETAPTGELDYNGKPVVEGSPVALMSIPAIGMNDAVVVDGTASGDLREGPGHLRTTPLPGNIGTSTVMGRATTYGGPFGKISSLHAGDRIEILGAQGSVTYTVKDVRRARDTIPPSPGGPRAGRLVLATAAGTGFMSALNAHGVVYVDADTMRAFPSGPVYPSVSNAETVMADDTTGLPVLVLLLAVLGVLVLAVSIARRRFPTALVWLVATPVVVAMAWAATDQAVRLLPNLM